MSKKPSREHIAFRQINKLFDDHKEVSPASESATQLAAAYHRIHRLIDPTGEMTTEQVVGEVERRREVLRALFVEANYMAADLERHKFNVGPGSSVYKALQDARDVLNNNAAAAAREG